jgi:hypothetical protein
MAAVAVDETPADASAFVVSGVSLPASCLVVVAGCGGTLLLVVPAGVVVVDGSDGLGVAAEAPEAAAVFTGAAETGALRSVVFDATGAAAAIVVKVPLVAAVAAVAEAAALAVPAPVWVAAGWLAGAATAAPAAA